ncbi:Pbp1p PWA37_001799 [Arxiozyma heterogenica]|uniref:LsmAD domain-containing protein n=1 Tax=Arxiozyma heterogenica TaxID=278026 RepID=A0AAN7WQM4_9SACH|nr:hypothetical protein RI543_002378 [Kazachstania heterogenica]
MKRTPSNRTNNTSTNTYGGNTTSSSSTFFESLDTTRQYNDRLDYLMINTIGHIVKVTVSSGAQYSGLLIAANLESKDGIEIILHNPEKVGDAIVINGNNSSDREDENSIILQPDGNLLIHGSDVMEIELKNIDFTLNDKWSDSKVNISGSSTPVNGNKNNSDSISTKNKFFKTDADISGANKPVIKERELQKWVPENVPLDSNFIDAVKSQHETLEESSGPWDQFSVNEQKFGVKSTYDEHFYTTKINKDDPNFEQRLKEAERLAEEIESQGVSGNIHIAEDRGIIIDDSGMDEEDLYSGVDRRGDELLASLKKSASNNIKKNANDGGKNGVNTTKKYVPPTLRNQPHHTDPAIISSTTSKNITATTANTTATAVTVNSHNTADSTTGKTTVQDQNKNNTVDKESKVDSNKSEKVVPNKVSTGNKPTKPGVSRKPSLQQDSVIARTLHNHHKSARDSPKPRIPLPSTKEAQIEELKRFSEKFKVPYDVPKDMKNVIKQRENKTSSKNTNSKTSSKDNNLGSEMNGKNNAMHQRRRHQGSFFGSKKSLTGNKKELFNRNFNFFQKTKESHDEEKEMEPFFVEKPYFTAPTWNSTVEESFKNYFPDEATAVQQAQIKLQQRQLAFTNSMSAAGMMSINNSMAAMYAGMTPNMRISGTPMMGFHAQAGMNPMMSGFSGGAMYIPFHPQPVFYPSMSNPMMPMMAGGGGSGSSGGGSEDMRSNAPSQTASPQIPHIYMNTVTPFGYPVNAPPFHAMNSNGNHNHGNHYNYHNNNGHHERNNNHRYHGHHGSRNINRNMTHTQLNQ